MKKLFADSTDSSVGLNFVVFNVLFGVILCTYDLNDSTIFKLESFYS